MRSEDAIVTDEPAICAAFRSEFNQWWGATSGPPNDPATGDRPRPLRPDGRRFRGVQASRLDVSRCGVPELRLVVEGEVREADASSGGKASAPVSIAFRRERVFRWFVPVP